MAKKRNLIIAGLMALALGAPATAFWFRDSEAGQHWLERQIEVVGHKSLMRVGEHADPAVFITDGCSGGMSAIWRDLANQIPGVKEELGTSLPWRGCCVTHDRAYNDAAGATSANASFEARIGADQTLRGCVANLALAEPDKTVEYLVLADAIYTSVRLGGAPCSGLPWRWGYGLPSCFVGHWFFLWMTNRALSAPTPDLIRAPREYFLKEESEPQLARTFVSGQVGVNNDLNSARTCA